MSALVIKNLPDDLHKHLKRRAARHRRSMTQEAIAILEAAVAHDDDRLSLAEIDRRRVRGARPLTDAFLRRARTAGRP